MIKEYKPKLDNFKFETVFCGFDAETWNTWLGIKRKKDKSDSDKHWLKKFREHLKTKVHYILRVTHKPSYISHDCEIEVVGRPDYKKIIVDTIKAVQSKRKERLKIAPVSKAWFGAKYETLGGVFVKKNLINQIAENTDYNNPKKTKKPYQEKTNYIGVELEFNHSNKWNESDIVDAMKREKLGKYVQVTNDPSCGHELRVLLPEKAFEEPLLRILSVLNTMGFKADSRCGTHVHMDMRNRDVKKVYKNMFLTQNFMRKFLTVGRKRNSYCVKNRGPSFDEQLSQGGRYVGLNCEAYGRHKTLEVRMHHGTLNADELVPWLKLLIKLVNYESEVSKDVLTLKQAAEVYKMDVDFQEMLHKRLLITRPILSKSV